MIFEVLVKFKKNLHVGGNGGAPESGFEWAGDGRPSLEDADCGLSDLEVVHSDGTAGEYFLCNGGCTWGEERGEMTDSTVVTWASPSSVMVE